MNSMTAVAYDYDYMDQLGDALYQISNEKYLRHQVVKDRVRKKRLITKSKRAEYLSRKKNIKIVD